MKLLLLFLSFSASASASAYSHNILYPVSEDTAIQFYQIKKSALQKRSFFRNLSFYDKEEWLKNLIRQENRGDLIKLLKEDNVSDQLSQAQRADALLLAIERGSLRVVKVLLDFGFNPNYYDKSRHTALIKAVWANELEIVKFLLNRSEVSINAVNASLKSSSRNKEPEVEILRRAVKRGHPEIVRALRKAGVSFSQPTLQEEEKERLKQVLKVSSQTKKAGLCRRAFSAVKGFFGK